MADVAAARPVPLQLAPLEEGAVLDRVALRGMGAPLTGIVRLDPCDEPALHPLFRLAEAAELRVAALKNEWWYVESYLLQIN